MDTVSAGRSRNVNPIVDEQTCVAAACDLHRPHSKLVKRTRGQRLLSYLNQGKLCGYDTLNEAKELRNCLRRRPAARYGIDDRAWKFERHRLQIVSPGSSDFAKQRRCV